MMLLYLLLSLLALGRGIAATESFVCPSAKGTFPHPESIVHYYECRNGKSALHICPSGSFDPNTKQCVVNTQKDSTTSKVTNNLSTTQTSVKAVGVDETTTNRVTKSSPGSKTTEQFPTSSSSRNSHVSTTSSSVKTNPAKLQTRSTSNVKTPETDPSTTTRKDPTVEKQTSASGTTTVRSIITSTLGTVNGENQQNKELPEPQAFMAQWDYYDETNSEPEEEEVEEYFHCPEDSGFFRHPKDCTRFYRCHDNKPVPQFCTPGTAFDPATKVCSWPVGRGGCGGLLAAPTYEKQESQSPFAHHRHTRDVRLSHDSFSHDITKRDSETVRAGRRLLQARENGRTGGGHRNRGQDGGRHDSGRKLKEGRTFGLNSDDVDFSASDAPFQCPGDGFYADPADCAIFYHCSNGKAYQHQCQPGTAFNKDKLVCSWPLKKDGCGGMLGVPFRADLTDDLTPVFFSCPDEVEGYYPDASDCTVFYHCSHGKAFRHKCGNGTAYNADNNVCAWPVDGRTGCGSVGFGLNRGEKRIPREERKSRDEGFYQDEDSSPPLRPRSDRRRFSKQRTKRETSIRSLDFAFWKKAPAQLSTRTTDSGQNKGGQQTKSSIQTTLKTRLPNQERVTTRAALLNKAKIAFSTRLTQTPTTLRTPDISSSTSPPESGTLPHVAGGVDSMQKVNAWPWESVQRKNKKKMSRDAFMKTTLSPTTGHVSTGSPTTTVPTTTHKPPMVTPEILRSVSTKTSSKPRIKTYKAKSTTFSTKVTASEKTFTPSLDTTLMTTTKRIIRDADITRVKTTAKPDAKSSARGTSEEASAPVSTSPVSTTPGIASKTLTKHTTVKAETYRVAGAGTDFRCPAPSGHFRDPNNCAIYYHCAGNVAFRKDCPNGQLYDTIQFQCLPIAQVEDCRRVEEVEETKLRKTYPVKDSFQNTVDDIGSFDCGELYGYFRNPRDCSTYFECIDGNPYLRNCMSGTVFDVTRNKCTWSSLVPDCRLPAKNQLAESERFRCPSPEGYYRDPASCSSYFHCIDGRPVARVCDPNLFFDPRASKCRWGKLVRDCSPEGQPIAKDKLPLSSFVCPLPNGHFRDPDNCSVFYHCLHDVPYRGACRRHHAFDTEALKCVPRAEIPGCEHLLVLPEWTQKQEEGDVDKTVSMEDEGLASKELSKKKAWDVKLEKKKQISGKTEKNKSLGKTGKKQNRGETSKSEEKTNLEEWTEGKEDGKGDGSGFQCPKAHGLFRDPSDCRVFYHCFSSRPFRHECQHGTVFSKERNLCTWPSLVPDCQDPILQKQKQDQEVAQVQDVTYNSDVTRDPEMTFDKVTRSQDGGQKLEEELGKVENNKYDGKPKLDLTSQKEIPHKTKANRSFVLPSLLELERLFLPIDDAQKNSSDITINIIVPDDVNAAAKHEEFDYDLSEYHKPDPSTDGINRFYLESPLPVKVEEKFFCPITVFDQYFRDPTDCMRFHRCVKGMSFTFDCPRGTFFDPVYNICDFQDNVPDCDHEGRRFGTERESLENSVSRPEYTGNGGEYMSELGPYSSELCPKSDGLFPHPSSCSKFVYCARGTPTVLTCPPELLYNVNTMTCDYDDNIVCVRYDK